MRPYEMMTILAPDVPEDELAPALETIEAYLTNTGANIVHISRESPWGRRRLAYSIRYAGRDVRDGFYTLWYFDAEPQTIVEIEREIRLNDRIIRHMVVALEKQFELIIVEPSEEESEEGAEGAAPVVPAASADGDEGAEITASADSAEAGEAPATDEVVAEITETAEEAEVPEVTAESIDAEVPTEAEDAAEE